MSVFETLYAFPVIQALGLALIHFCWQGLLIGSLLSLALIALGDRSPRSKYATCLAAMLLMLAAPIVTTGVILSGVADTWSGATQGLFAIRPEHAVADWTASLLPWFTGFWALGTTFLQARLIVDWLRARRARSFGIQLLPRSWQSEVDDLRARLGIEQAVRVFESSLVRVPSVVGCLRPVVLVPIDITARLTPPQLRAVIAHELAHIRRHDCLVNLLQNVFESVLFFHPVVWWVSNRLHTEREYCCDDIAVSVSGSSLDYAHALSSLEEFRGSEGQTALASTGGGSLMKRIARITGRTASSTDPGSWLLPAVALAGVIALMSVLATGCDTHAGGTAASNETIVGPAEAGNVATSDQDIRMSTCASVLESCRDRGFITNDQLQVGLKKMSEMAADGKLAGCDPDATEECRIMVRRSDCCPEGANSKRVGSSQDLQDCIRGMEGVPETSEIKVEEVDLGQGAALAVIRIEDGDVNP